MATRKKPARVEVPRRARDEITEEDCKAAESILDMDYMNDVRGVAKDLARAMKAGEVDDFHDALHEAVDGTQRVIYTHQAKLAVLCSPNADAFFEEFGDEGACTRDGIAWERLAFVAMQRDVEKELDVRSVDVNDPDSWPDIDLKEFD
ncbi:MAG TPA: hypothetical protein VNG73_04275 [Gemmatimonadaceae bacterium]|nr:hypothetical protein [Gemmatimonadaceae bacterium]